MSSQGLRSSFFLAVCGLLAWVLAIWAIFG